MKYDSQLSDLKNQLPQSEDILITLPSEPTVDQLAAGLALYLSLEQNQKRVSIVSEGIIKVAHTHLYGVGQVQNNFPQNSGGNLIVTLGGVVDPETRKPTALKELTWDPEGSDLKLIFHTLPGKRFEPTHVTPSYMGGTYPLIIVIGASKLSDLGSVYHDNTQSFEDTYLVNIDNKSSNTSFGNVNLLDPQAASISEMVSLILPDLNLAYEGDIATNLLNGIYESTANLQDQKVTADTFLAVAESIKRGGVRPTLGSIVKPQVEETKPEENPGLDMAQAQVALDPSYQEHMSSQGMSFDDSSAQAMDETQPVQEETKPVEETKSEEATAQVEEQASPEEVPAGEEVSSGAPESDWLTPKIYKGGSLG